MCGCQGVSQVAINAFESLCFHVVQEVLQYSFVLKKGDLTSYGSQVDLAARLKYKKLYERLEVTSNPILFYLILACSEPKNAVYTLCAKHHRSRPVRRLLSNPAVLDISRARSARSVIRLRL